MFKIYTLGDFDIKIDGKSILESIGNQNRLLRLFKYFLTLNGRKIVPYKIMDELWAEEEYSDPLSVLRTQISRLRNIIDFKKYDREPFFTIDFIDGYYLFELQDNCEVDFIKLENCINQNKPNPSNEGIVDICKEGVSLYKGEYLAELGYEDWLMPARNRIDRLYVMGLTKYLESLKEKSMDVYIISTCEEAIVYRPHEEIIHLFLIESLINVGQTKCALNHYEYCTQKIYTDIGLTPSNRMKDMYEKIKTGEEKPSTVLDLSTIDEEIFKMDEPEGAVICDRSYFSFLYNCITRVQGRDKSINAFVGIITIYNSGYIEAPESDVKEGMLLLLDIIYRNLRKGDVITQWNKNQILVLLFKLEDTDIEPISERIRYCFNEKKKNDKIILNIKFKRK